MVIVVTTRMGQICRGSGRRQTGAGGSCTADWCVIPLAALQSEVLEVNFGCSPFSAVCR